VVRWWKNSATEGQEQEAGHESWSRRGAVMEVMEERVMMAGDLAGVLGVAQIWDGGRSKAGRLVLFRMCEAGENQRWDKPYYVIRYRA
jgi:hypothetical protein